MSFNPVTTLQSLAALPTSQPAQFATLVGQLAIPATIPGQVSVTLTVASGSGPFPILPNGLTLTISGWVLQSTNSVTVLLTSSNPTVLQFNVTTQGTAGAIVAGTALTVPIAFAGLTASAVAAPSAPSGQTYPSTDWETTSTSVALLETAAQQQIDMNATLQTLAMAGFLATAPGNPAPLPNGQTQPGTSTWLDYIAVSEYGQKRGTGAIGQYSVTLACTDPAGTTIKANGLVVTIDGLRYVSTNSGNDSIFPGTSTLTVQAESVGAAFNGSITVPGTPVPIASVAQVGGGVAIQSLSVTANNYLNSGASTVVTGVDVESDTAYLQRCLAQWSSLIAGPTAPTFQAFALDIPVGTASGDVSAAIADCYFTQGSNGLITAYVSNANITPSSADGGVVFNALWLVKPLCTSLGVVLALPIVQTVSGTVYAPTASITAVQGAVTIALSALQATFAIGDGSTRGVVRLSEIYEAILSAGATAADITAPTGDPTPGLGQVEQLNFSSLVFVGT